ncbi:vacuolar assembly protein vps41 [Novymonas esmeraldas]|uniref:Vacuolar assembly protein vps41 n=1 Tax=Novymonas esmeraldas TaxID=1808958 RepID=A0AAW0ELE7_9TRYP
MRRSGTGDTSAGATSRSSALSPSPAPSPAPDTRGARSSSSGSGGSAGGGSHHTEEKGEAGGRRTSGSRGGGEGDERHSAEEESYTSYYEYDSDYDSDSGGSGSGGGGGSRDTGDGDGGRSSGAASQPPQEDLLRFLSYTLDETALKDHRLMAVEAFRHVLVLGTNQGTVAVVEPSSGTLKEVYTNHHEPICDLDCNVNELYIAACDKAGYVTIQNRREAKDVWMAELSGPIESVALHPLYHKMDSCPMVCGGASKVLLLTKGVLWSNSRRVTTLQEGRGRIHKVRWCHTAAIDVVAWLSDAELTLYDMKNEAVVRRVALPGLTAQNALYPSTLRWERATSRDPTAIANAAATLLCGWGDVVQEVRVLAGSHARRVAASAADASPRSSAVQEAYQEAPAPSPTHAMAAFAVARAAYTAELRTPQPLRPSGTSFPYRVCGIAPYGPQQYVVLACIVDRGAEGVMKDLEVRVVDRGSLADVYRGRMPVRFIHPLQLHLTYLDPPPPPPAPAVAVAAAAAAADVLAPSPMTQYFIRSVDTIVKAMPSDTDDHVAYLLRTSQFERAYRYAVTHARVLRRHVLEQVGQQWLMHLFAHRGDGDDAAVLRIVELLPEVISRDSSAAWEQWIYRLDTCGESWRLVALLPGSTGASAEYRVASASAATGTAAVAVATLQAPIRQEYYDLVLLRCLRHNPSLFYAALHKFHTLFSVSAVLKTTEALYRECCASAAWWEDGEDGERAAGADGGRAVSPSPATASSPLSTSLPADVVGSAGAVASAAAPAQRGSAGSGAELTPAWSMDRTSRWSLAASYGFLLRCAGRHEEALQVLLHLPSSPRSDREVFGLIRDQQLFHKARTLLPELLHSREEATLQLLMEHVAAPSAGHLGAVDEVDGSAGSLSVGSAAAAPDSGAPSPLPAVLDPSRYGSGQDPLCAESVVSRLEHSDRLHLLRYLNLVQELHPRVFVQTAKHHAQLVATLYMDYDRPSLLPFLRQMSMYVERIRELHALCRKHRFLEEEIFLLFRMGREDEALRILVARMHDLPRALRFVVSVPDREEQAALFARLVDYTVTYNASLPSRTFDTAAGGAGVQMRYLTHTSRPEETYASIAERYRVSVADLCSANGVVVTVATARRGRGTAASPSSRAPRGGRDADADVDLPAPPPECIVPLNLFGSFLEALAEPEFMEHPALDVRLVLRKLPGREPVLHAGPSIAAIAHTMATEIAFFATVSEVGERDLMGYYGRLLKRRTAAIAMGRHRDPASAAADGAAAAAAMGDAVATAMGDAAAAVHRCAACRQLVTQQVVVFACQHMYHPVCVLHYLRKQTPDSVAVARAEVRDGALLSTPASTTVAAAAGGETVEEQLRHLHVHCHACHQHAGGHS